MTGINSTSIIKHVGICSSLDYQNIIFDFHGFKVLDDMVPTFKVHYQSLRNIPKRTLCFIIERRDRLELIVDSLIGLKDIFDDYSKILLFLLLKKKT